MSHRIANRKTKCSDERLVCQVCRKRFHHLGSHIWHKHKMLARDYKTEFELPYKMGLVSEQVRHKQRIAENKWKGHKNFKKGGKKYQFKKGHTGQRRISDFERAKILKQIINVNREHKKLKQCPVCRMQYNHVESHLYQVHKLVSVERLLRAGLNK